MLKLWFTCSSLRVKVLLLDKVKTPEFMAFRDLVANLIRQFEFKEKNEEI